MMKRGGESPLHLSLKLILVFFGVRLVYFVEEKSEHFANCFSSDRIK